MPTPPYQILVCRGPTCGKRRNAQGVFDALRAAASARGVAQRVELGWKVCFGRCTRGPNALVRELVGPAEGFGLGALGPGRNAALYGALGPSDADELIRSHVMAGTIVERLAGGASEAGEGGVDARSAGAADPARAGEADSPAARSPRYQAKPLKFR